LAYKKERGVHRWRLGGWGGSNGGVPFKVVGTRGQQNRGSGNDLNVIRKKKRRNSSKSCNRKKGARAKNTRGERKEDARVKFSNLTKCEVKRRGREEFEKRLKGSSGAGI